MLQRTYTSKPFPLEARKMGIFGKPNLVGEMRVECNPAALKAALAPFVGVGVSVRAREHNRDSPRQDCVWAYPTTQWYEDVHQHVPVLQIMVYETHTPSSQAGYDMFSGELDANVRPRAYGKITATCTTYIVECGEVEWADQVLGVAEPWLVKILSKE
jgi:hypothetical protein